MCGILLFSFFSPPRIHTHVIVLSDGELQLAGFLMEPEVGMTGRLRTVSEHYKLTAPSTVGSEWLQRRCVCSVWPSRIGRAMQPTSTCAPETWDPCWDVLTSPSNREFVERLVLQKRQRDKGLKDAFIPLPCPYVFSQSVSVRSDPCCRSTARWDSRRPVPVSY